MVFTGCEKFTCNDSHSMSELAGTWTCFKEGFAEALVGLLRVNQSLDLTGKKYDHIKTFVSNVKGLDKDIEIMGSNFNFAKMDGLKLNKMLKTLLFAVDFPNANTIRYNYFYIWKK